MAMENIAMKPRIKSHFTKHATPCTRLLSTRCSWWARVLWLQPHDPEHIEMEPLSASLAAAGLLVYTLHCDSVLGEACRAFDLILIRVTNQSPQRVIDDIALIRKSNLAPIVLLIDREPMAWLLTVLPAGADDALLAATPAEIIVARCLALLYRWLPVSHR